MTFFVNPDDFTGSDTDRFEAALASVPWTTNDPLVMRLTRSKYTIDRTILLAPEARPNGKIIVEGHGAELGWTGTEGPMLQVGHHDQGKKVWWSRLAGLRFELAGGSPTAAIVIDHADALRIEDCHGSGGACGIRTSHLTKYLDIQHCFLGGTDIAADVHGNVVTIHNSKFGVATKVDGKAVAGTKTGLRYQGSTFDGRCLDFSFCAESGVEFFKAANVTITGYSEKIGPRLVGNTAAVVRATASNGLELGVYMNCTNGSKKSGTHAAYGLHLTDCSLVNVGSGGIQLPSVAGAFLGNGCTAVTFRRSARWEPQGDAPLVIGKVEEWFRE